MSIQKNGDNEVKLSKEFDLSEDFPVPSYEEWKNSAEKLLKGQPFDKKLITKTYEGINLQPIYTRKDTENLSFVNSLPGEDNFLRGTDKEGYLKKSWDICQEIYSDSLIELNKKLKEVLKKGQTAIFLDLDILKIKDLKDFSDVLDGIDIKKYPIYIKTGCSSNKVLNILMGYAGEKGNNLNDLNVYIEEDPIGFLAKNGTLCKSLNNVYDEMESSIKLADEKLPNLKVIGVNGTLYHNSGADSVTELAVSLATAVEYLREMTSRGIDINVAAKQIFFVLGIGTNFFMEIGKIRAARVLWQKVVEEFGGNKEAQKIHLHAKTSFYYQSKLDPFVNTLRTTTEAFSAIIGGADAITTSPYDETYQENSDLAIRIARNIQIILKEESNLQKLIDPAGGSYYVESLTEEIIKSVWSEFQNIEKQGGILEALKNSIIQDKIDKINEKRNIDIFKRKSVIVGTNMFVNAEDKIYEKKEKVNKEIEIAENELKIKKLTLSRISEPYEEMRKTVADFIQKTNSTPKVYLANIGTVKQYKGRADFSRGYFEVGGFDVIYGNGFIDFEKAVLPAIESGAEVIVICSDDPTYPEIVEKFVSLLKNKKKDLTVILAGFPGKKEEQYRGWGVDDFIFMGSNLFVTLESLLKKTGVK